MTRVIVWSVFIILLLSGCAYLKKEKMDNEIIVTDLPPIEMTNEQKIACIKLKPECND
jgi:phenolic acid decarboxylase